MATNSTQYSKESRVFERDSVRTTDISKHRNGVITETCVDRSKMRKTGLEEVIH